MRRRPYPNAPARIIGASDPKSPIIGRPCKVLFMFTDRPPHTLWGDIWRVASVDGKPFKNLRGEEDFEVNVAEDWLEIIEDDPNAGLRVTEKDIETV